MVAAAQQLLDERVHSLPGRQDIASAPFAVEIDGTLFGLVRECHGEYPDGEEPDGWAEFHPNRLGFSGAVGRLVRHVRGPAVASADGA